MYRGRVSNYFIFRTSKRSVVHREFESRDPRVIGSLQPPANVIISRKTVLRYRFILSDTRANARSCVTKMTIDNDFENIFDTCPDTSDIFSRVIYIINDFNRNTVRRIRLFLNPFT